MSRTSRREQSTVDILLLSFEKTAIYVRKSPNTKLQDEIKSESIENQIGLLKRYIDEHKELELVEIYIDDGWTGTNFNRPAFQKLLMDISNRKISCIVVKDFSRFGRNHLGVGYYLESIFPILNIRFISVNDNYDSKNKEINISFAIKNLMNELYAKDISTKIKSFYETQQKQGSYLGSIPPYGYLRNPDNVHQLIIDNETAPIVKKIYLWRAEGQGYQTIALKLNTIGILPPFRYYYEKGFLKNDRYKNLENWHTSAIVRITQNRVYLGDMIQGKYKSYFADGMKHVPVAKENWVVVKGMHEPIIEETLFQKVQEIGNRRTEQWTKIQNTYTGLTEQDTILKGKVFCGDCTKKMIRKKNVFSGKVYFYYRCPSYEYHKKCIKKSIREDRLIQLVRFELTQYVALIEEWTENKEEYDFLQKQKQDISKKIKHYIYLKASVYESFHNNLLDKEEFIYANNKYNQEIEKLNKQYLESNNNFKDKKRKFTVMEFAKIFKQGILNEQAVQNLIDKIEVFNCDFININFSCQDIFKRKEDKDDNKPICDS